GAGGKREGKKQGRDVEHRDQRHAAQALDEGDREPADDRHPRPAAKRQQDAEGEGAGEADDGKEKRERQAAPLGGRNEAPGEGARKEGDGRRDRGDPDKDEAAPPEARHRGDGDQSEDQQDGRGGLAVMFLRIEAEEDEARLLDDEGPAGAAGGSAGLGVARPGRVEEGPAEQGRDNEEEEDDEAKGDGGVERRAEEAAPEVAPARAPHR